jgi:hypothetical protein
MYDWNNFKARCSSIHAIVANSRANPVLTEKQKARLDELEAKEVLTDKMKEEMADLNIKKENGNKVILSDVCIGYLMEEYAWRMASMVRVTKEIMDVPQMQKGTMVEPDSLRLLTTVTKDEYKPNLNAEGERERVYNDYLSGEVDAYVGESIMTATRVPDIKSIWDYPTFLCKLHEPISTANDWQLKGYGDITGATDLEVANCLVNTPETAQYDISRRLLKKLNEATDESIAFKMKWAILEHSMNFDQIPARLRVSRRKVEPMTDFQRQFVYDRVKICREWLQKFDEEYQKI